MHTCGDYTEFVLEPNEALRDYARNASLHFDCQRVT